MQPINQVWPPLATVFERARQLWREIYPDWPQPFMDTSYRSNEEQQRLYNQGRTTKGQKVTNALPGQSLHNYNPSYAFDIAFKKEDGRLDWSEHLFASFAAIVKTYAPWVEWGGEWQRFKDRPHFEIRGYHWTQAKAGRMPTFK